MKNWLIVGIVILSAGAGMAIFLRGQKFSDELRQARETVGTQRGGLLLEKLARTHPDHAEIQFLQARQLRLQGHHDRALVCCQRAADLGYPSDQVAREILLVKANQQFQQLEHRCGDRSRFSMEQPARPVRRLSRLRQPACGQ